MVTGAVTICVLSVGRLCGSEPPAPFDSCSPLRTAAHIGAPVTSWVTVSLVIGLDNLAVTDDVGAAHRFHALVRVGPECATDFNS